MPPLRPLLLSVFLLGACALPASAAHRIESGTLEAGALYSVAVPQEWNGRLLLLAHGLRNAAEPLHAHLFPERGFTRLLLESGWMVAITSYRRNGVIVRDAIDDLENLRAHIARTHGKPRRTFLMGDSMGGLIVTRIAERHPENYDGAVAVGSALHMSETGSTMLNRLPRLPLLYLSNQSEITGPFRYCEATRAAPFPPVLWVVARDGHVAVNAAERFVALAALEKWVERGERPLENANATRIPKPRASIAVFPSVSSAECGIAFVHPVYRYFISDFLPDDFMRLGISVGTRFRLHVAGTEHEVRYIDDPEYSGNHSVAIADPEGVIVFSLRGRKAREVNVSAGERVRVESLRSKR